MNNPALLYLATFIIDIAILILGVRRYERIQEKKRQELEDQQKDENQY